MKFLFFRTVLFLALGASIAILASMWFASGIDTAIPPQNNQGPVFRALSA